ncbi:unnamed protein product [Rhizoctonia solani]|uniref:BTB domain-containing protein n=1 Tax=Rhizoctonia solani TaxID=456999 RepID=A0A8H3ALE3_9AGAM|nr:unnamed protein product [Rhizoctonia solani]
MSGENNATVDSVPAINEGFRHGGDLTLRSTDNVDFSVHSLFLSVASPVFAELLGTENRDEVIRFSEKAKVLALMLGFIYPRPTPTISSMELLNDALRVAEKYKIDHMKSRIREQFITVGSPVSVYADPIAVLYTALTHGLSAEVKLAAILSSKNHDLGKEEDLKKLLDMAPTPTAATLVGLTGIPLVKTRVLTEVLFRFESSPMLIAFHKEWLVCSQCRAAFKLRSRPTPPEWQIHWARWIFDSIKNVPIAEWKQFFSHSNVYTLFYKEPGLCSMSYHDRNGSLVGNCSCLVLVQDTGTAAYFQPWADGVYEHLKSRLSFIAEFEDVQARDSNHEE